MTNQSSLSDEEIAAHLILEAARLPDGDLRTMAMEASRRLVNHAVITPSQSSPAVTVVVDARVEALKTALTGLLHHAQRQECLHEDTHRGGAIWTICDACGAKWADDEGGFPGYEEPEPLARAREALEQADVRIDASVTAALTDVEAQARQARSVLNIVAGTAGGTE